MTVVSLEEVITKPRPLMTSLIFSWTHSTLRQRGREDNNMKQVGSTIDSEDVSMYWVSLTCPHVQSAHTVSSSGRSPRVKPHPHCSMPATPIYAHQLHQVFTLSERESTLLQEREVMGGSPLPPTVLTHSPLLTIHTLTNYTRGRSQLEEPRGNPLTPSPAPVKAVVAESESSAAMTTPP